MINHKGGKTITDTELLAKEIPPVNFIVPELLPASGLAVIGGAPKMGKSLMMTDLGLAIANGSRFLNFFDVGTCEALYLCLEDTEQRMKDRIKTMQPDCPASGRIHFAFVWEAGSVTNLSNWLDNNCNVKAVIIDTLGKFSPSISQGDYSKQYQKIGELKKLADTRKILIAIVHHLRKAKSDDPFEMLYGSNALSGVADLMWILQREKDGECASLMTRGRDVPEQKIFIKLNQTLLSWTVIDPITEDLFKQELQKIYDVLRNKGTEMTLGEISITCGFKKPVLSKYISMLIEFGYVEKTGYGKYRAKKGRREENVWAQKAITV